MGLHELMGVDDEGVEHIKKVIDDAARENGTFSLRVAIEAIRKGLTGAERDLAMFTLGETMEDMIRTRNLLKGLGLD